MPLIKGQLAHRRIMTDRRCNKCTTTGNKLPVVVTPGFVKSFGCTSIPSAEGILVQYTYRFIIVL